MGERVVLRISRAWKTS